MIPTIEFQGRSYLGFQAEGFAAQFAFPFAEKICKGFGYDIGCGKVEWALPGAVPIDLSINDEFHANNLPPRSADYIFSSHCLEHVDDWVRTLEYWIFKLKERGCLFLYLPDYSQLYWRPWNNRKHKHVFTPQIMRDCLEGLSLENIFVSGVDLNNSFICVAEKR